MCNVAYSLAITGAVGKDCSTISTGDAPINSGKEPLQHA